MKKYNKNDIVNIFYRENISVEEVIEIVLDHSGDGNSYDIEEELKIWKKSFEGGKKYVVRGSIGSRGLYEGIEVIREDNLLEKDLIFGSDYWILRESMLKNLEEEYKEGYWSKEEYKGEVEFWNGSSNEISYERYYGMINDDDNEWRGVESSDEESFYYFLVDKLKK